MKIIFDPNKKHIQQIESWLHDQFEKDGEGHYYSFKLNKHSKDNFLCCVNDDGYAIGFIIYRASEKCCTINVASVKNSEKRKGVCKLMLEALTHKLRKQGMYVLNLFCSPPSSEKIWKKLGFMFYREKENQEFLRRKKPENYLYKNLVESLKPTRKKKLTTFLELWRKSDYLVNSDAKPSLVWDLENPKNPIIYPVEDEWKLRFVENDKEIYNGVLKKYISGFLLHDDFLIYDKI